MDISISYIIKQTTRLLIGHANTHCHTHLMLCHVLIIHHLFYFHYCTPFILILMIFTQSFSPDDHACIHLGSVFVSDHTNMSLIHTDVPFLLIISILHDIVH